MPASCERSLSQCLSIALNLHKFRHNFRDTIIPMCPTNNGVEDAEHFLLHCPSFDEERRDLLTGDFSLLQSYGYIDPSNKFLIELLLYGDKGLSNDVNRDILQLTLQYIHKTGRFD